MVGGHVALVGAHAFNWPVRTGQKLSPKSTLPSLQRRSGMVVGTIMLLRLIISFVIGCSCEN